MITELTKEQLKMLPKYRDAGIEIGLATGPEFDEEKVRELTDAHRESRGVPKATNFLVYDSPFVVMKKYKPHCTPGNALYGQHDINWLMYYMFYRVELGLTEETEGIVHLFELAKMVGWMWMSEDTTIVTRRPSEIHLQVKPHDTIPNFRVLHNYNDYALKYADGTGVYAFQGITIPENLSWVVTTPEDELDVRKVMEITNTEVRTEVLKKIGVERAFEHVDSETIDSMKCPLNNEYTLLKINFDENDRIYLRGVCPSSGSPFFEAVPPKITSCEEALHWREYTYPKFDTTLERIPHEYTPSLVKT